MVNNLLGVGMAGDDIVIINNRRRLTHIEAINLAAWIVAMTDKEEFDKVLKEVMES